MTLRIEIKIVDICKLIQTCGIKLKINLLSLKLNIYADVIFAHLNNKIIKNKRKLMRNMHFYFFLRQNYICFEY